MKIRDLQPRHAITVSRGDSLRSTAKHLVDDEIGAVVVMDASGAAGVLSERDLARAVADGVDLDDEQVGQYMTEAPLEVGIENSLGDAIAKMNEFGVRHLVVVEGKDVIGVVSMRDVVALLGPTWPEL